MSARRPKPVNRIAHLLSPQGEETPQYAVSPGIGPLHPDEASVLAESGATSMVFFRGLEAALVGPVFVGDQPPRAGYSAAVVVEVFRQRGYPESALAPAVHQLARTNLGPAGPAVIWDL